MSEKCQSFCTCIIQKEIKTIYCLCAAFEIQKGENDCMENMNKLLMFIFTLNIFTDLQKTDG